MLTNLHRTLRRRIRARSQAAEAGFTLVELLVVIVILGVLSAIVVFSVRGISDKGQGAACKTDRTTIQTAEEAYFAGGRDRYATMAELVRDGFLSTPSGWYDVSVAANGSAYTVALLQPATGAPPNPCT
ncbi:type IV pilin protein [Kitasatospora sp. NPDC004289]